MDIHIKKELKTEIYEEQYSRSPNIGDLNMSCISNNFSSFFLDSLNDPSEFAKYLGNATDNKTHPIIDEQVFSVSGTTIINGGGGGVYNNCTNSSINSTTSSNNSNNSIVGGGGGGGVNEYNISWHNKPSIYENNGGTNNLTNVYNGHQSSASSSPSLSLGGGITHHHQQQTYHHQNQQQQQQHPHPNPHLHPNNVQPHQHHHLHHNQQSSSSSSSSYDSSFEFSKYLRHSEYGGEITPPNTNCLIDLDSTPPPNKKTNNINNNINNCSTDCESYDHNDDSKNNFDVHNSNENSTGISSSDQRLSSNTSECSDSSNNQQTNQIKPLMKFVIKENFEVHQAHKVEEGIFQHMNKLPIKKKETLKQLGVTFTGHMSINDKSIIVDNFARFCEEYNVNDHRPFLALNQSGMLKPEQIKFARYLGQGLPNFTLFCIYSNFKNLFCTKRFENYAKGTYNLHYILEKTKRFLTCTTADLKNLSPQMCEGNNDHLPTNNNGIVKHDNPKPLERLTIFENFDVHESHRIEDGIFTHISRLSPKKQELLKQFGIQSNHNVTYYEKHIIIENFIRFCNEYGINDHRPFLDFHESGLPKMEQIKFARYLGQGLPNLTLYKTYNSFKDLLAMNRLEKLFTNNTYSLDVILKKKKKNLLSRMNSAASREHAESAKQGNSKKSAS